MLFKNFCVADLKVSFSISLFKSLINLFKEPSVITEEAPNLAASYFLRNFSDSTNLE